MKDHRRDSYASARLFADPWAALTHVKARWQPRTVDILAGYIGSGAYAALGSLRLRARIILGLPNRDPTLEAAQLNELALLLTKHQVRWRAGLHAKTFLAALEQ